ncbi:hypothetical protein GCM10027348_34920 [Hymenobacter tenuis]
MGYTSSLFGSYNQQTAGSKALELPSLVGLGKDAGVSCSFIWYCYMLSSLLRTSFGRLRAVGFLEGISFLVLLGIAMPLKYLAGQPEAVRIVGMAHGVLFVLYVLLVLQVAIEHSWSWRKALLALVVSVVPFGTFWADKRLFRE